MGKGRHKLPDTALGRLDLMPPFLAWALARIGKRSAQRRPSPAEAAAVAGIPPRTFNRIATKISWSGVKAGQIDPFLAGCNVKLNHLAKEHAYMKAMVKHGRFRLLSVTQQKWFARRLEEWNQLRAKRNGPMV
jgi:hypothetical protein